MQALILAAGRGSRLDALSGSMPKPLVQIGPSWLIDHQLEMLSAEGIGHIAMVVGYREDEIREIVKRKVEYIHNPRWAMTNSLYSFSLAREWIKGSLIILNCDVLFHPDMLDRLLRGKGNALLYDSTSGRGREQMKVKFKDNKLIDICKSMPHEEANGENVGILKFTSESVDALFEEVDRQLEAGEEKNWLGIAIKNICKTIDIEGVDIAGMPWAEIDFPYDLESARKEVWPAIEHDIKKGRVKRKIIQTCALIAMTLITTAALFIKIPPEIDWDTVDLGEKNKSKIFVGERKQKWWILQPNETVGFITKKPGFLRIETRLIFDKRQSPYVIEILLDGKSVDWFKRKAKLSKKARFNNLQLAKKERIEFTMPANSSKIEVKLIAKKDVRCAIRIRQAEEPEIE
ncbi:NTP transferase domain-containing protein [Candidatus Uabimicrobium sp. HlEnr_7]|uniref:phosphocholine cytidylyltransferase family protein n=1 Tax=Candidatus Uabimicrobium helgolandensis TaxID=3095367 RepID=UPI003555DB5B